MGVWYKAPGISIPKLGIAPYLYFIDREQSKTLEDIGMVAAGFYSMTGGAQPERVPALAGNGRYPADSWRATCLWPLSSPGGMTLPNMPKTVVLTYGFWQRHFGARSFRGRPHIGSMDRCMKSLAFCPRGFAFPSRTKLRFWCPCISTEAKPRSAVSSSRR